MMKCRFWLDVSWGTGDDISTIAVEFDSQIPFVPQEGMEIAFGRGAFDMAVLCTQFCMVRQLLIISLERCHLNSMRSAIQSVKGLVGIGWRVEPSCFDLSGDEEDGIVNALLAAGVPVIARKACST